MSGTIWRVVRESWQPEHICHVCDKRAVAEWLVEGEWLPFCTEHDREMIALDNGDLVIHNPQCCTVDAIAACGFCLHCEIAAMSSAA